MGTKVSAIALFALVAACRSQGLVFQCATDSQCGAGGVCVSDACAFADATCPSGFRFDKSASVGGGACVAVAADMATTPVDDMTITCASVGQPCSVGVGACKRSGTIVCSPDPGCSVTAGVPDNSWHDTPDPATGSWDYNCDGKVEYQQPFQSEAPPLSGTAFCQGFLNQTDCTYNNYWFPGTGSPCGQTITFLPCTWIATQPSMCISGGGMAMMTEKCK